MREQSDTAFNAEDVGKAYWHAPYTLPDGLRISATRQGNDKRVPARADMLRALVRRCCGDLVGRTVLDLGCADGYFSRVALSLGAESVRGLDVNPDEIAKARWLSSQFGDERLTFDVADAATEPLPNVDVVLCLGLLYHLEDPLNLMRRLAAATRELVVIDTDVLPLAGPLVRLEVEDSRSWKTDEGTLTWVPTAETLTILAYTAGFSRQTQVKPDRCAPVDYRSGRRRMTAFHVGRHPGRIPQRFRRPADDRISKPFSGWYMIGGVAYRVMSIVFRVLEPLTRRW